MQIASPAKQITDCAVTQLQWPSASATLSMLLCHFTVDCFNIEATTDTDTQSDALPTQLALNAYITDYQTKHRNNYFTECQQKLI